MFIVLTTKFGINLEKKKKVFNKESCSPIISLDVVFISYLLLA